jgi:hypothetical protein
MNQGKKVAPALHGKRVSTGREQCDKSSGEEDIKKQE